ncbi:MAG: AsmA family protein, partial [Pseudomonadota bacterium]
MKRILIFAGIGLVVLLIAAAIVPFLIPSEVYKRQIEEAATNALGREVAVQGDVSLSIFPQIAASVDGVSVANPEGFSREHMVEAGALKGVVKWGPLLSRRVEVAEIAFVDADVMLERRDDGAVNWEFGPAGRETAPDDGGAGGSVDAGIDRARLENARLVFDDRQSGARYEISELDLEASLQSLADPLTAEAAGLFQGARFDVDLSLDAPQTLLDGAPAGLGLSLDTEGGALSYDGNAQLAD